MSRPKAKGIAVKTESKLPVVTNEAPPRISKIKTKELLSTILQTEVEEPPPAEAPTDLLSIFKRTKLIIDKEVYKGQLSLIQHVLRVSKFLSDSAQQIFKTIVQTYGFNIDCAFTFPTEPVSNMRRLRCEAAFDVLVNDIRLKNLQLWTRCGFGDQEFVLLLLDSSFSVPRSN